MTSSRLLIIDGTSGVWKEDLLAYVSTLTSATLVRKVTTRAPYPEEDFSRRDLEQVEREEFTRIGPKYQYEYSGELYGVTKSNLDEALRKYSTVFVIIRNFEIIQQLKSDYARCRPTSLFVYADSALVAKKVNLTGSPAPREAMRQAFRDFLRNPTSYDEILVNAGTTDDFYRLLDLQVRKVAMKQTGWHRKDPNDKIAVVIATKPTTRHAVQVVAGAIAAAAIGITVNLLTMEELNSTRALCLGLACTLVIFTVFIELLFAFAWRRLD
jgi:guanylate kinase